MTGILTAVGTPADALEEGQRKSPLSATTPSRLRQSDVTIENAALASVMQTDIFEKLPRDKMAVAALASPIIASSRQFVLGEHGHEGRAQCSVRRPRAVSPAAATTTAPAIPPKRPALTPTGGTARTITRVVTLKKTSSGVTR